LPRHSDRSYCVKIYVGVWVQDSCWKTKREAVNRRKYLLDGGDVRSSNIKINIE
jgi:hypothetical protein